MKNEFFIKIKQYFPSTKQKWKAYLRTTIPIMLASLVFTLNAFVDNFMSTNIEGGNQALAYANTWTEIEIGIISLTTIVGTSLFGQYVGKKDFIKVKEVISFRILFALLIAIVFAIPAAAIPREMVMLISGFDKNMLPIVLENSTTYLRLITISWVLNAIAFTVAMILREKHHGVASFIASLISLLLNIILNSIFVFGLNKGIDFLAYSTIISIAISLLYAIVFIIIKDKEILINPLKIFCISKQILRHFFDRIWSFIFLTISSICINLRFIFWNIGFPTSTIGDPNYVISAANILGISGMFFNIFWTSFESINANFAVYVGKELGHDNFDQAKTNANELQGFHLLLALSFSIILFALSFGIEKMEFLADGYEKGLIEYLNKNEIPNKDEIINNAIPFFMKNIKYTLWTLCFFMPIFIWFISRSRVLSTGGLTNLVSIIEMISSVLQIGWIALIVYVFTNINEALSFPIAYSIFFISDICKLVVYEIVFKKANWIRNITIEM